MAKKMYFGTGSIVYTEVECIETSGTQYIDTGIGVVCQLNLDIQFVDTGARNLMGASDVAGNYFGVDATGKYELGGGVTSTLSGLTRRTIIVTSTSSDITLTADGETITRSKSSAASGNFMLCGGLSGYPCSAKLYSCQIYSNGVLMRDYVPCKRSDGVYGLYDTVNSKFYVNAGSGVIAASGAEGAIIRETGIAREVKKMFYGTGNLTLTEVEYLESSGTQYIDTGFIPNQDTRIVCEAYFPVTTATTCLFGVRTSQFVNNYSLTAYSSHYRSYFNTTEYDFATTEVFDTDFEIDKNKNVTTLGGLYTTEAAYASFTAPGNLYIFAMNNNGTTSFQATAKIYSFKIYDNGTLVRDYVPVKRSDGVYGLYDIVNSQFYANAGSGVFTAGTEGEVIATTGIARKVKKGYVGDANGLAKLFFAAECNVRIVYNFTSRYSNSGKHAAVKINGVEYTSTTDTEWNIVVQPGTVVDFDLGMQAHCTSSPYIMVDGVKKYNPGYTISYGDYTYTIDTDVTIALYDTQISIGSSDEYTENARWRYYAYARITTA